MVQLIGIIVLIAAVTALWMIFLKIYKMSRTRLLENEPADLTEKYNIQLRHVIAEKEALEQKLYDKVRQHSVLYEIISHITKTLDIQQILEHTVLRTKEELQAQIGFLMLVDKEKVAVRFSDGLSDFAKETFESKLGEPPFGDLILKNESLCVKRETPLHPFFESIAILDGRNKIRDLLAVPLKNPLPGHLPQGILGVANSLSGNGFTEDHLEMASILAGQTAIALENAESVERVKIFFKETIGALAAAINQKHRYTHVLHSKSVSKWAVDIAQELNLPPEEIEKIEIAGLLHDVGKIAIPDAVLTKPGLLTDEEKLIMNEHPDRGAEMLNGITMIRGILPYIRHHHERWDGAGYPDKLAGEHIPLGARIVSLADSFDAMIANRPYHKGATWQEAMEEIKKSAGTQFDPTLVEAFTRVIYKQKNPQEPVTGPVDVESS